VHTGDLLDRVIRHRQRWTVLANKQRRGRGMMDLPLARNFQTPQTPTSKETHLLSIPRFWRRNYKAGSVRYKSNASPSQGKGGGYCKARNAAGRMQQATQQFDEKTKRKKKTPPRKHIFTPDVT